jgi:hypothetical protein
MKDKNSSGNTWEPFHLLGPLKESIAIFKLNERALENGISFPLWKA